MLKFQKNQLNQEKAVDAADQKLTGNNLGEITPKDKFLKLRDENCDPAHGWRKSLDIKQKTHYGTIHQKSIGIAG